MASIVQFGQDQAFRAKYWYERLQYTAGPAAINTGSNPVFSVNRINKTETPAWVATLESIAATQNGSVALDFTFDRRRIPALVNQGLTDALPSGMRSAAMRLPAVKNMSLVAYNYGTSAVNNFIINYQVSLRRLTVADKLLMGIDNFTKDELDALNDKSIDVRGLVEKGIHPIPVQAQVERTYMNRILYEDTRTLHVDALTSDQSFLTIRSSESGPDTFLVLREIALEGTPSVILSVDRDEDYNYMGVIGSAFLDADDRPWDVFVPALNYLTFHIQAVSAPVTAVPVRVRVWHCKLSNLMRVRFGLAHRGDVPDNTYLRAIAGVI